MTKQKSGFWLFIFSLIPGAGEMYMGFKKQGISIMGVFWLTIALAASINLGWILMVLPIIWFYSFFNVHNLKSLTEEEFYSLEDDYIFHLGTCGIAPQILPDRVRMAAAAVLIIFGVILLWNSIFSMLEWMLPSFIRDTIWQLNNLLPRVILSLGVIYAGVYLIKGKKKELEMDEDA